MTSSASSSASRVSAGTHSSGIWNTLPLLERIETTCGEVKRTRVEDEKQTLKAARETVYNDIARMMRQQIVWDPAACRLPPVQIGEPVDPDYMDGYLGRPLHEPECVRGKACLGLVLAPAFRGKGYVLGQFELPLGRRIAGLCVMCLRLALTQNGNSELGMFRVSAYELGSEWQRVR